MDTPLVKRAYNLGLKAVPNFIALTEEQITFYEQNLDKLQEAIIRGFIVTSDEVEQPLDFIIHVDRLIKPIYPSWVQKVIHPELECSGPKDYNLRDDVELWLHENQKVGYEKGQKIYKYQKDNNLLEDCLNLQDLLAILTKDPKLFKQLFPNRAVFAWKSVVKSQIGHLFVPYLVLNGEVVKLFWDWLDNVWFQFNPALRFR